MSEDRKEPPYQGGSQPVPHEKEPIPGPGRTAGQIATGVIIALIVLALIIYIFWR